MTEQPVQPPRSVWYRLWNDPLHFFCAQMLACLVLFGLMVVVVANSPYFEHHLMRAQMFAGVVLVLGAVSGLGGFILSLIPPVRRGLTRMLARRFFWLACVITFIVLAYAEEDWRGRHALKSFEAEWAAKGAKFDIADIAPSPVPDDQNFALTPIVFSSYGMYFGKDGQEFDPRHTNVINELYMFPDGPQNFTNGPETGNWKVQTTVDLGAWQNFYRELATKTNLFAIPSRPGTPADDVLLALSQYDPAIEELRQASQMPYSRYPVTYGRDEPAGILLPHLATLKRVTITLRLRACAELQAGQADKALADVKLMLYLNNAIRTEPFLISHLVRLAMLDITLQPVYEGLAAHRWSDAQLAELDAALAGQDYLADFKTSMRGELAFGITETDYMRRERNFQALQYDRDGQTQNPARLEPGLYLAPAGFFYQNELQLARMNLLYIVPSVDFDKRIISPDTVKQNTDAATADEASHFLAGTMARMTLPAVMNSLEKFAAAQANVDLARVAIALERYRLAHGEYAENLDALSPQFLTAIPHDIINGQPLHYRRTVDGLFVLYSVGWNETDDGGVVVLNKSTPPNIDRDKGDWVWKY